MPIDMLVPHEAGLCIICRKRPPFPNGFGFSEEHVIPASLGGILTCKFLCKSCNDNFGNGFEARAKTDPSIRLAIGNLKEQLPALYASIEKGQAHLIRTEAGVMPATYNNGEIRGKIKKLVDNSLMVPVEATHEKLREILSKDGIEAIEIENILHRFEKAPEEQNFELAPGRFAIKRKSTMAEPDFSRGVRLDPLVCLKIAYEFAGLIFGSPVFDSNPALNEIRRTLCEQDPKSKVLDVESLMAEKYQTFHGVAFEGNDPYAKFQIRLFGRLAYRVHLRNLSFKHKPVAYTHDLVSGEETLH